MGRGIHYPIALEGALKLKEITYIHAEAYPAGELKHGPLALVDKNMPVVVIAPNDNLPLQLTTHNKNPATGDIDANGNKQTVVIFSDYEVYDKTTNTKLGITTKSTTLGSAVRGSRTIMEKYKCLVGECSFPFKWGNAVVLFDTGNTQLDTFGHELGHSFSLPHTFDCDSKHIFYKGYTDNLMDYVNQEGTKNRNPYEGDMWALFKWQWDIIRKDRSINYN